MCRASKCWHGDADFFPLLIFDAAERGSRRVTAGFPLPWNSVSIVVPASQRTTHVTDHGRERERLPRAWRPWSGKGIASHFMNRKRETERGHADAHDAAKEKNRENHTTKHTPHTSLAALCQRSSLGRSATSTPTTSVWLINQSNQEPEKQVECYSVQTPPSGSTAVGSISIASVVHRPVFRVWWARLRWKAGAFMFTCR